MLWWVNVLEKQQSFFINNLLKGIFEEVSFRIENEKKSGKLKEGKRE